MKDEENWTDSIGIGVKICKELGILNSMSITDFPVPKLILTHPLSLILPKFGYILQNFSFIYTGNDDLLFSLGQTSRFFPWY